ncbi:MAG TPA: nitric oxide reductase [Persephonella sp.]|uniref:Nitric oxide reductase, cytochrome B subunit n=1 Tax=Persephonella marina (strain DSM 14350 / EX-H1) TaxID=123214 RepID=C0QTU2_PERMH|nr:MULTISPECIES: cbb3-type cytochrome c oxidase subunit I [Persephonella]ACO04857.1 nitric oxide reductase, cytochrome B subunit [Persephonella marina EX-H1]HCB70275.1 nitric oxide reductase [Persephonella sp.]
MAGDNSQKKWFLVFVLSLVGAAVIFLGLTIKQIKDVPPIPKEVRGTSTLYTYDDVVQGKAFFQKYVLMNHGTLLGNGAYIGPDYTSLFLHKKIENLQDIYAQKKFGRNYADLTDEEKGLVDILVKKDVREISTLKEDVTTITPEHEQAYLKAKEYLKEFLVKGNPSYAWIGGLIKPEEADYIVSFVDWSTLVAVTTRPGTDVTYTNNWPPEPAIGLNAPYSSLFWSLIAFMACWSLTIVVLWAFYDYFLKFDAEKPAPSLEIKSLTPMQEKVLKFVPLVPVFFVLQVALGGYLAHLYADPAHSWIVPQSLLPFNVARSFHLNLAVLWIAIGWLAGGLFIAPLASKGKDFKFPIAVDILWVALVIVGLGGLIGLWLGALGKLPAELWFWLGNEGREYIELARVWDIGLVVGLVLWFTIVFFTVRQAEKLTPPLQMIIWSAFAIAVLYMAGMAPLHKIMPNFTIDDYFRWWVVHLWVENTFELFAAGTLAFLTVSLGLVSVRFATIMMFFEAFLIVAAGTLGTGHHYFWMGENEFWIAVGGVLSSLEPLPLVILMVEASKEYLHIKKAGQAFPFRMSFLWLVGSAFLNWLGAGFYGMLINLPIINYYEHGTYFGMAHGHVALLGAFGYISIAFLYFIVRANALAKGLHWDEKISNLAFWMMTAGIFLYAIPTLVIGEKQMEWAFEYGYWAARTREVLEGLGFWMWVRIIPDSLILAGAVLILVDIIYKLYLSAKEKPATAAA